MSDWYLLVTKPHKDAYAEEQLNNQGYTTYRPLVNHKKKVRGKIKEVEESLFPRYIFIQLKTGVDNWSSIRSTRGVLNIVRFGAEFAKVPEALIQKLQESEDANKKLAKDLDRFKGGDRVVIEAGPFIGIEGVFKQYKGDERVIVLLNVLQQATKLEIPLLDIEIVA